MVGHLVLGQKTPKEEKIEIVEKEEQAKGDGEEKKGGGLLEGLVPEVALAVGVAVQEIEK